MDTQLRVMRLHDAFEYIDQVAVLLNQEWTRKDNSWTYSLEKSNPEFPMNLILVNEVTHLCIAQCKLSKVSSDDEGLLIESVVVDKTYRGQGYGKRIMKEAEKCALEHNITTLHLSTHDKETFYERLGYVQSNPVTSLGSNSKLISGGQLSSLLAAFGGSHKIGKQDDGRIWMKKELVTP